MILLDIIVIDVVLEDSDEVLSQYSYKCDDNTLN